jgi:hypothetical protein
VRWTWNPSLQPNGSFAGSFSHAVSTHSLSFDVDRGNGIKFRDPTQQKGLKLADLLLKAM